MSEIKVSIFKILLKIHSHQNYIEGKSLVYIFCIEEYGQWVINEDE